jgi:hypothetical protein
MDRCCCVVLEGSRALEKGGNCLECELGGNDGCKQTGGPVTNAARATTKG